MSRIIVIFLAATVIGYYGWRVWNENNRPQKVVAVPVAPKKEVKPEVKPTVPTHTNLKDKNLHQAFAKILAKEKAPAKKKNRTIDELIQYNLETGSVDMTDEERKLVIEKLQKDVSSFGGVITSLYAADQNDKAEEFEIKLEQKREQLENFRQLDRKIAGVKSENY